ncbi:pyruvate dehydrogenase protein X component [Verticillium dahliae VdLs.17]|uniref:Pyruvate dehydrogenase protein X component n=1 Tax=Verticillium dahliae (strain VdLs.17 / ATCC MYA-4575 / FGSC 10137) TaxID=498257 RepID=G2X7F6_VERDV|nr:pyruvate dehydrogenase protein X component [Verticillium dahliae VdLs.17]EGY14924.1 pyruvate dehydrogenase protein X component [Verticillium dahliae VdLs.17]
MASLATACRLSARMVRRAPAETAIRGFRSSARCAAAQNFTMPALSPTMTEGNIATWKVKEGDSFSAGDVLLEIETDKATMDVEAQDDGIVFKIMSGDGSKAVQVGTRIAVLAEAGDDVSQLEVPADESAAGKTPQPEEEKKKKKEEKLEANADEQDRRGSPAEKNTADGKVHKQKYPLLPSVQSLVHQHGIDADTLSSITPTGPQGRLLKGDILAHLGTINRDTPAKITERFAKLAVLDLSNIKIADRAPNATPTTGPKPAPEPAAPAPGPAPPARTQVALPISLAHVAEAQRRIQDTLGVFMPVSTFIARAADKKNEVLAGGRGVVRTKVPPKPAAAAAAAAAREGVNTSGRNLFTLVVPRGDEKRAAVFLERIKVILENEPGRLVL